jgi:DNA-binding LytR/AlgR family response regulator
MSVTILGEAESAEEAVSLAETLNPDVVFLDIRMPGMSGIQATNLFTTLEPPPFVILVTGTSEHAVEAFEKSALDYLLKPVSSERLEVALAKARTQIVLRTRLNRLSALRPPPQVPIQRLPIRITGGFRIVGVETILYAMSSQKCVFIRTKTTEYRSNYTLAYLEGALPAGFMRVHASCIVNLAAIEEVVIEGNHAYAIKVLGGQKIPLGRQQYPELQARLGFPA